MTEIVTKGRAGEQLYAVLQEKASEVYGSGSTVQNLTKMSAGASRETWSFDVIDGDGTTVPLILKRDPVVYDSDGSIVREKKGTGVSRTTEGQLVELGGKAGVPVPDVPFYLEENDHTTEGFIMLRLEGETLGRRILREDIYADARTKLAYQCGHAAACVHGIPIEDVPELSSMNVSELLNNLGDQLSSVDHPYPGFEYGLRWLGERHDLAGNRHTLVHGDFRNGNIIVGPDGLRALLDWEIAYFGNPMSDLGWICVPSWRYGHMNKPVGGFGEIEDLLAGYEAGGGEDASAEAVHYWSVFGALRWGVMCVGMAFTHINGPHPSFEKAAIGRRTAETEYDLLRLVD
ncbi:MAG TPA: phosphotransferase family protein [Candidatus Hydrogenedentes bacterium]|nr:phosphotransferase family protein [Candidatus Hydrogenedentota bacterium]